MFKLPILAMGGVLNSNKSLFLGAPDKPEEIVGIRCRGGGKVFYEEIKKELEKARLTINQQPRGD